jgi:hypothetical protein
MRRAAEAFQTRFGVEFTTLTNFTADALASMHRRAGDEFAVMEKVYVASDYDRGVLADFDVLTRIANSPSPSLSDRGAYLNSLLAIYRRLEGKLHSDDARLLIAPEREGRMLAQSLGWLRNGHDLAPHAKRIPYEHGLLVGVSDCAVSSQVQKITCIDGAIASGATLMAILGLVATPGVPMEIYSVHAAREGLRAIIRFCNARGLPVRIYVGHATEGLSSKFYAVAPHGAGVAVGDLGDMIAHSAPEDTVQ